MSAFSEQLRTTLEAADMSQSDLAAASRVSQPTISRYLKGEITPEAEAFGQLLDAIPESLHFELILARLSDELPRKYRDSVTILAQSGAVREDASPYMPRRMAADLRRAFSHLAEEAVQHQEVRDLVLSLARALGGDVGKASSSALDDAIEAERRRRNQGKRDKKSS